MATTPVDTTGAPATDYGDFVTVPRGDDPLVVVIQNARQADELRSRAFPALPFSAPIWSVAGGRGCDHDRAPEPGGAWG